jgi:hypothetical protein
LPKPYKAQLAKCGYAQWGPWSVTCSRHLLERSEACLVTNYPYQYNNRSCSNAAFMHTSLSRLSLRGLPLFPLRLVHSRSWTYAYRLDERNHETPIQYIYLSPVIGAIGHKLSHAYVGLICALCMNPSVHCYYSTGSSAYSEVEVKARNQAPPSLRNHWR